MSTVYVSFDLDHDRDLYERLVTDSGGAGFRISGRSKHLDGTEVWADRVRRCIRSADQVVVICGEHSGESQGMHAELRIAQEERTPYFLLWGRREMMCTKPLGARPADGMFSWTREILQDQVTIGHRRSRTVLATARAVRPTSSSRRVVSRPE